MIQISAATRLTAAPNITQAKTFIQENAGVAPKGKAIAQTNMISFGLMQADVETAIENLTEKFGPPKKGIHGMTRAHWHKWDIGQGRVIAVADCGKREATMNKKRGGQGFQYSIILLDR